MRPFRFTLQRIFEFRAARLAEEERKLAVLRKEIGELNQAIERIGQLREESGAAVVRGGEVSGHDLQALAGFKAKLRRDQRQLFQKRSACTEKLVQQREAYMTARSEYRILEKLRNRHFAEWFLTAKREVDNVASELYLARWKKDQ